MQPLEALLKVETEAIEAGMEDVFPLSGHQPYMDIIIAAGSVSDAKQLGAQLKEHGGPASIADFAENATQKRHSQLKALLSKEISKIEKRFGVKISETDTQSYLVQLARRALDYADEHLPGLEAETLTGTELMQQAAKRASEFEEGIADYKDERQQPRDLAPVVYDLKSIRRFYNDAVPG